MTAVRISATCGAHRCSNGTIFNSRTEDTVFVNERPLFYFPPYIPTPFFLTPFTTAAETYGPHMGCIWATYGDLFCNIWSFFNIWGRKSFRKHNIWATYGSLFQTYGVLLKHIGPFWNIWGLSETYGAFRERSLFLFPTCHIALFRYMSFFFLKSFANHKSGLFPIFLPKKNVCWKFQGEPETCFLPSKLEPESHR